MRTENVDVLVIGAGPSGTVAASIINKAGFKVKIVEKQQFPRFVIGESLLPKCMEAFEEAGFIDALKAQGYQDKNGAKFVRGEDEIMDFDFDKKFTKGWDWTWQAPRADFDTVIANEVAKQGVEVEYKATVTNIEFEGTNSTTTVVMDDGSEKQIKAKFIVDGSGYGRVIPRLFDLNEPSDLPARKTLFTHIKDVRRSDYIEPDRILIIDHAPGVWAWCIPFSNGNTSVGFVSTPDFFEPFTGTPEEQLRAILKTNKNTKDRFEDCEFIFEPRVLQAWSISTKKFYGDGFVLTGNVTEFLDPVFSSGVTLAAVSSQRAAHLVVKMLQGKEVDWEKEYTEFMAYGVDVFRSYVFAWYTGDLQKAFFSKNPNPEIVSQICSVLAGYAWDDTNPFVKNHKSYVPRIGRLVEIQNILEND